MRHYLVTALLLGSLQQSEAQPGNTPTDGPPGDDANKPSDPAPTDAAAVDPMPAAPVEAPPVDTPSEATPEDSALQDALLDSLVEILDTPVSAATKFATSLETVPASVTVYTRDDLEAWGFTSVAEVLRFTVGFYVVDDHSIPNVGTRGFAGGVFGESGNIKVLINGNSVAFRSTGGNWLGRELIPMSAVERIEIVRGPVSSLYGADAFLGVVNIVTRKASDINGGMVRAGSRIALGKTAGNDIEMMFGGSDGALEVMGALIRSEDSRPGLGLPASSPDPQVPANHAGRTSTAPANLSSLSAIAQLRYRPTSKLDLSASIYRSQIDRDAQFSPWLQLTSGVDAQGRSQATHIALGQTQLLLNATYTPKPKLKLSLDAFYFRGRPRHGDRIEVGSDVFYVERRFGFEGVETRVEAAWAASKKVEVLAGAEVTRDREEPLFGHSVLKSDVGGLEAQAVIVTGDIPKDEVLFNSGVYSLANWKAIERYLTVTGGMRVDRHSVYGNEISGRIGIVSTPFKTLTAKLMGGRAFKAPSALLLYSTPLRVGDISGNSRLAPQVVQTLEGNINWAPSPMLRVSSEVAYSLLENSAEFVQQGLDRLAQNVAEVRSLSWTTEMRARYRFFEGIASFETQKVAEVDSGDRGYAEQLYDGDNNASYPAYIARLGALFTFKPQHVRLGAQVLRVGKRTASESNTLARGETYQLPEYTLVNLRISSVGLHLTQSGKETSLSAEVTNLFDQRGPDPGFAGVDYPLTRRTFFVWLRQEL